MYDTPGELVCVKPFPAMPVTFWHDEDGKKYRSAYFDKFPGVWAHGDFCQITSATGGVHMLGRSDGVLNPSGVRFGSAEIYNITERIEEIEDSVCVGQVFGGSEDERVVLFLKMREGSVFGPEVINKVKAGVREALSPRHVPHFILETHAIPYTINGKKVCLCVFPACALSIGRTLFFIMFIGCVGCFACIRLILPCVDPAVYNRLLMALHPPFVCSRSS